jgi:Ser/Thr protein kinase RdoA (MazF antagonist)
MSNAMHPGLRAEVLHRYRLSGAAEPLIGNGDECELWRVDASPPVVVRLSPPWRSVAGLAWTHRVARTLAVGNAEVICPLPGLDGTTIFAWRDRPVSVWPYVQGHTLNRDDANQRTAAAGLLARLHRSALSTSDLNDAPPAPIPPDARVRTLPDPELDAELTRWHDGGARAEPRAVVHGDFYRRNILCRAGKIVGLIDWDDAHVDLLAAELAWATWELAKAPTGDMILIDRASCFIAAYQAADGPVTSTAMLVPLIRDHLRLEVALADAAGYSGHRVDENYRAAEIRGFQALRQLRLPAASAARDLT